jgi:hypothetical protein
MKLNLLRCSIAVFALFGNEKLDYCIGGEKARSV